MLDLETKVELLILGIRTNLEPLRKGGAGPLGLGFEVNGSVVSAPVKQNYVKKSPYSIKKINNDYFLFRNEKIIGKVNLPKAEYYKYNINGIPARRIVALDGIDALVSAVSRKCIHWESKRCIFCSIQENLKDAVVEKKTEIIAEVVKLAYEEDNSRHLTLTTGTTNLKDKGALKLAEVTRKVKEEVDIKVHVQLEPVNKKYLEILYESGVDTIGIHVETFDERIRKYVVPAKPSIDEFFKAWNNAVNIFGEWKVSSWLLLGLGESFESVVKGFIEMSEMAVVPFIAPFRPSLNSNLSPPKLKYVLNVYREISKLSREYKVSLSKFSAGCPKCNGCSVIGEIFLK